MGKLVFKNFLLRFLKKLYAELIIIIIKYMTRDFILMKMARL